jgi:uncharacterized membrane protein
MQALDRTLHGNPFTIYSLRAFDIHTFAYGPISLFVMAPFKLFSEALGAPHELERWLVWLPIYFADVLAALLLCRFARRSPLATPGMLLFVYTFCLSSWLVFFASPVDSHFESLVLVFLLLGLFAAEKQRFVLAGVLVGLAMLTKQSALVIAVPALAVVWRSTGWKAALKYAVAVLVTGLVVMLPYMVSDFDNVWYMAFQLPGLLPVAYQSVLPVWRKFPALYDFLVDYANVIIIVLICAVSLLASAMRKLQFGAPRTFALFAVCALIMLDFEKWGYPHFFILSWVMLLLWELLDGKWPWAAMALGGFTTIMYVLNADIATRLSFSVLIAPLALLLFGLTGYALVGVFRKE